jgi:hypothetical protein
MKATRVVLAAVVVCAACGDAPTDDARGYTKAPLERPGLRIHAERPSDMRAFGEPDRPSGEEVEPAPAQPQ